MRKSNITLIGMPGAGKSTIGIILAKNLAYGFIDTDVLIQINQQKSLQQIIDETDHLNLRKIEAQEILKLNIQNHVIATGGSAAYSEPAMRHLETISHIVFLDVTFEELKKRIHNSRHNHLKTCFMNAGSYTSNMQALQLSAIGWIRRNWRLQLFGMLTLFSVILNHQFRLKWNHIALLKGL